MNARRLLRTAALAAISLASLAASAMPAAAEFGECLPSDPDCVPETPEPPTGPPPPYVARPDLRFVSGSARAIANNQWELRYTIRNVGDAAAPASTTRFLREGSTLVGSAATSALAPSASQSRAVVVPRSGCWDSIRFDLDATGAVTEHAEWDNQAWVVGRASAPCPDDARYRVRVVRLRAVTAQEQADEPYVVFSSATDTDGSTWSTPAGSGVGDAEDAYLFQSARCVLGTGSTCNGVAAPLGIGIGATVMEHDSGDLSAVRETIAEAFDRAGLLGTLILDHWIGPAAIWADEAIDEVLAWFDDDEIGTNTWGYSPTDLARLVPLPGNSIEETRAFHDGDRAAGAFYHLTLEITRTA